jgi:hypothetical protein
MDLIQRHFPKGRFRPPASAKDLVTVEKQLGVKLPLPLRKMYLHYDGFREDRGHAAYLLPLTADDGAGSLLSNTLFFFIFFGLSSCDHNWGISWKNQRSSLLTTTTWKTRTSTSEQTF